MDFGNSGLSIDLRYDYLNQNRMFSGAHGISPQAASAVTNDGDPQEVERFTKTQYFTAAVDYSITADWGVNVQVPFEKRSHSTLGTASDGVTPGDGGGQYDATFSALGDVRIIGRYLGLSETKDAGLLFGVKLPTGSHTLTGNSTDPTAPDPVPIDRGLQPGSGTTDIILGAFKAGALGANWDYFIQGRYQFALHDKDDFRPGNGANLDLGLRYLGKREKAIPELQLNARHVAPDSGTNADTFGTGGTLVDLSPGIVVPVGENVSAYGFIQVPIYQDMRGVQLVPRYTASLGVRFRY
jgi:hypothetical protein